MRSVHPPTDSGTPVAVRSAARISTAAARGLGGWSGPSNRSSRASPPNFSSDPAAGEGDLEHRAEDAVEDLGELLDADPASRIASRSDRFVNPEMSMKQRVPSTSCHRCSPASSVHSHATRGTNRSNDVACPSATAGRLRRVPVLSGGGRAPGAG